MEFKLPFPTLKSLSSLRICLHWVEHKLGPFQDFSTSDYSEKKTLRERYSHLSLDGLHIPRSLKAVVGDVLSSILYQLSFWLDFYERLAKEVQFFHFDAFGWFDKKRTLKPVIQKKAAEKNDFYSLYELLTDAYDFWLLPEVDAILKKMVAIASNESRQRSETKRESDILMEGPRPEIRHGKYHLVYRFVEEDAAQSLTTILEMLDCRGMVTIVLERESIALARSPGQRRCMNFDAFKDHFDLFEPSEREGFFEDFLNENIFNIGIKFQLDIFTFLKQKNYQRNWMLEFWDGHFSWFFKLLLTWPFTSLFIITFEHLAPHLTFDNYCAIFSFIVMRMPAEEQYGVVHRNVLVYYWSVFTADKKRMCATFFSDDFDRAIMDALKVKAPSLHDTIKTELDSLMTATDKE